MSDTIIVGVETRRPSDMRDAIALAARLARWTGAELLAVTVLPPSLRLNAGEHEHEMTRAIELADAGLPFEVRALVAASPARTLHELAERTEAAAVVIGPSLRDPDRGWLSGSVAEMLLHGGGFPVAIASRGHGESTTAPAGRIGVGFLDTEDGRSALRHAAGLAARAAVPLHVITVTEPFLYSHLAMAHDPEGLDVERALETRARSALDKAVAGLPAAARAVPLLVDGSPVPTLRRLSGELDLLVLGSRSYGAPDAVLLGPVSRGLVRRPVCPVMIVPRAIARDDDLVATGTAGRATDEA